MPEDTLILKGAVLKYLKEQAIRLGFRDAESLAHFLVALAGKTATRSFTIVDMDGKQIIIGPTDKMLRDDAVKK